ncbi:hypothetical protein CPB86DRAFT_817624 [Serendipita vermifera]|nr:hypothetical protein CPB86DRAFT_817624 [Serendipita vermifera]
MSDNVAISKSIIILNEASQTFVDNAPVTIAPWVMGAMADLFLQGILTVQITNYFTYQSVESYRKKTWLVIGLTVLCILKSTLNILNVWELVITSFCDPDAARNLLRSDWKSYSASFVTAVIAIVVQSFFVLRYWRLTKAWYICLPIIIGMILSITASITFVITLAKSLGVSVGLDTRSRSTLVALTKSLRIWSIIHFVSAILVDVAITTATAWYLYNQKPLVVRSTSEMIDRLIRMVWQSALPPTICVIVNAVLVPTKPSQHGHIAINMVLPKLYAISLMYTLNLGQRMKSMPRSSNGVSLSLGVYAERWSLRSPPSVETGKHESEAVQASPKE